MKIIPAILTDDSDVLEKMIRQAEAYADYIQIDVVDGRFVNRPKTITAHILAKIKTRIKIEVHLMVKNPEIYIEDFKRAGAKKIVFHSEKEETLSPEKVIEKIRATGLEVGLAVSPETPVSKIEDLLDKVDSVLFLSVHPGSQSQEFIPWVLDKIAELKRRRPDLEVGLDGGIKLSNVKKVEETGADFVCVGSGIFGKGNPKKNFCDFHARLR